MKTSNLNKKIIPKLKSKREKTVHFCYNFLKNKNVVFILMAVLLLSCTILETSNFPNNQEKSILSQSQSVAKKEGSSPEEDLSLLALQKNKEPASSDFHMAAEEESLPLTADKSAISVSEIPFEGEKPLTRNEIQIYVVQEGDTISDIARKFGLYWSTILWENDLTSWSLIRPGDELRILPVDGITHKVKSGETLSSIASKYKSSVEKIVEFNPDLKQNSSLQAGETIIVPDGSPPPPPKPKYVAPNPQYVQENYANYNTWWNNTKCHRFIYGQCTSWAAFKWATEQGQCVPSWGNAKSWWSNAQRAGYRTGYTAEKGAIMVLTCTSWQCGYYGHVAYVESFDNNTVTISELNAIGYQQYSKRTLTRTLNWQNGWKIIGYIYPR